MFLTTEQSWSSRSRWRSSARPGRRGREAAAFAGRRLTLQEQPRARRKGRHGGRGSGAVPDDDGPERASQLDEVRRELSAHRPSAGRASREREQALEASRREARGVG